MSDVNLNSDQLERYSRHIILDGVEAEGQQSFLDSRVLVIGAGGLGAPIIQYLAAAGIGTLGIADDDVVEKSNLQRQVIYNTDDIGRSKVESATEFVEGLNPDVTVEKHEKRVTADNVQELIDGYEFVIDGTDNFQTRYLVNDACTLANVPFSHGAIYRFEGQVITFPEPGSEDAPCYRCLFPEAPPEGMVPDCATTGVLGVLPGVIGLIQATEAIKYLLDEDGLLDGRMIFYDALEMEFEEIQVPKNPDCPICGRDSDITTVHQVEYTDTCSISSETETTAISE